MMRKPGSLFSGRTERLVYLGIVFVLMGVLAYKLRAVINPLLIALLVAYIVDPAVRFLVRRFRLPRSVATVIIFVTVGGFVGGVGVYLFTKATRSVTALVAKASGGWQLHVRTDAAPPDSAAREPAKAASPAPAASDPSSTVYPEEMVVVAGDKAFLDLDSDGRRSEGEPVFERDALGTLVPDAAALAAGWHRVSGSLDRLREFLLETYETLDRRTVQSAIEKIKQNTGSLYGLVSSVWAWISSELFGGLATAFGYFVLVPVYLFFLLQGFDPLLSRLRGLLPGRHRTRILTIMHKIDRSCAAFFRGRFLIAIGKGTLTWLGLWIVGIEFAPLIGIVSGALSLIPFLGPVVGMVLAVTMSYVPDGWLGHVVAAAVVFAIVEVLEAVVNPLVLGREVGLHPVTILIALFAFGELFGLFGLLLAIPLGAIAKILGQEFILPELRALAAERPDQDVPGAPAPG